MQASWSSVAWSDAIASIGSAVKSQSMSLALMVYVVSKYGCSGGYPFFVLLFFFLGGGGGGRGG